MENQWIPASYRTTSEIRTHTTLEVLSKKKQIEVILIKLSVVGISCYHRIKDHTYLGLQRLIKLLIFCFWSCHLLVKLWLQRLISCQIPVSETRAHWLQCETSGVQRSPILRIWLCLVTTLKESLEEVKNRNTWPPYSQTLLVEAMPANLGGKDFVSEIKLPKKNKTWNSFMKFPNTKSEKNRMIMFFLTSI